MTIAPTESPHRRCERDYCGHRVIDHSTTGRCIRCPCSRAIVDGLPFVETAPDARPQQDALFGSSNRADIGYVAASRTSRAAAESQRGRATANEQRVLGFIRASGEHGRTCDEAESELAMLHQTASAVIARLKKRGLIRASNQVRRTRSGATAAVYVVNNEQEE